MLAGFGRFLRRVRKENKHAARFLLENSGLTPGQINMGKKAMRILGLDDTCALDKEKLVLFLYAVGLNPTDDVIDSKLRSFKLHDHDSVTFPQVCHIWHSMLKDLTDEEEILRRAFQFFDKDGNGEISVQELRTTMHELGDLLTEDEILSFMAVMDVNNDGVIGYQEFLSTLKTQTPDMDLGTTAANNDAQTAIPMEEGMDATTNPRTAAATAEGTLRPDAFLYHTNGVCPPSSFDRAAGAAAAAAAMAAGLMPSPQRRPMRLPRPASGAGDGLGSGGSMGSVDVFESPRQEAALGLRPTNRLQAASPCKSGSLEGSTGRLSYEHLEPQGSGQLLPSMHPHALQNPGWPGSARAVQTTGTPRGANS